MIHLEEHRPRRDDPDGADGVHALRGPDLRRGLPGRRHQAERGRRRAVVAQAALHRLLELRARLPVRRAEVRRRVRPDDEVRHVLRPHLGRAKPDVRVGVPERGAVVRHPRGVRGHPHAARSSTSGVRQPGRRHQGAHRGRRPRCRSTCSAATDRHLAGRPLRPRGADGRRAATADSGLAARLPATSRGARTRSPAASSSATSSPASGGFAAGNVGIAAVVPAALDQHRRAHGRSSRSPRSPVGDAHLFSYPTDDDPAILVHLADGEVRGVQPEVHPPRLRRLLRGRRGPAGTAPATRATSTPAPAPSSPDRRRDRSAASTSRSATTPIWALGYDP